MKKKLCTLLLALVAIATTARAQGNVINTVVSSEQQTKTSTVYVGEVVVDGVSEIKYLYSGDITLSSMLLQNLLDGLNGMADGDYAALLAAYEDYGYIVLPEQRLALCSNPDLIADMDANWSSAGYVGTLYYADKSVVSEINSNLYDLDAGFKAVLDAKTAERIADIDTIIDEPKCIVSHLGTDSHSTVYYTVENSQIIKHVDTYVTFNSEATTVIYTKVELETLMTETPLTFEAVEAGTINIENPNGLTIEYNKNNTGWTSSSADPISIAVAANDVVAFRGNNSCYWASGDSGETPTRFTATNPCYVYGNVMSLVHANDFATNYTLNDSEALAYLFAAPTNEEFMFYGNNTTLQNHPSKDIVLPASAVPDDGYMYMFAGCQGITRAPELPATTIGMGSYHQMFADCAGLVTVPEELPATTLGLYCYDNMFFGCTSMEVAPQLPATTLADGCYMGMFSGCTSLSTAPALPATTLAEDCYHRMFEGCTSLIKAPDLPAATLFGQVYGGMFDGCTSLNYVKCLATDLGENVGVYASVADWLNNVSPTGTFVKHPDMNDWLIGTIDGIPAGWTVKAEYTVPSSGIGTFSSPTNMLLPDGLTAHYCTTYNNSSSTIAVSDIDGGIVPANTGVLMRGTGGETYLLTVTTDAAADITDNALVAVVEATHIEPTSGDYTNFMLKSGKFVKIAADNGDVKMPANRAYLQVLTSEIPTGGDAKSISLLWGGDVTVIGDPSVSDAVPAQWYTIDGRKLNAKPTAKGLYIVNGKKVIIR